MLVEITQNIEMRLARIKCDRYHRLVLTGIREKAIGVVDKLLPVILNVHCNVGSVED